MHVKNWHKFQHFKDRRPPWIKLYRDILDDLEWHTLDDKSAKVLVMLWVIASENDGNLPDSKTLAFRLRMDQLDLINCCSKLSHWLILDDINTISDRYQSDTPERETERETEREEEAPRKRRATPVFELPDWINREHWDAWHSCAKRRKATAEQKALAVSKLEAWRKAGQDFAGALENAAVGGWQGLFLPDAKNSSNQSFSQQAADIARTTVPAKPGKDPALASIERDMATAAPIPLEVLEKMAAIRSTISGSR